MDYDVETFGDLGDKFLCKPIRNKIHVNQNLSEQTHAKVKQLLEASPYLFYLLFQCFEIWNKERGYPISLNYNNPATKAILEAMRTIAHSTRKGWDNSGKEAFPLVRLDDIVMSPESLKNI